MVNIIKERNTRGNNVKLWVKGNTIFGAEECEDHVYRESWDIEDCLFDYIDIVNIGLHFILKNVRPYAASCSEA